MKRRAFTLIEILIVIIVIAALAGILFITMGSGDAKAKEAACLGERNKIKTAFSTQLNMNSRDDFQTALNTVVTNESPSGTGTITDVTTDSSGVKHAVCSGLCKSGGKYHVDYANGIMYISCDIHGGDEYNLTTAKNTEPGFTPNGEPGHTGSTVNTNNNVSNNVTKYDSTSVKNPANSEIFKKNGSDNVANLKEGTIYKFQGNYYLAKGDAYKNYGNKNNGQINQTFLNDFNKILVKVSSKNISVYNIDGDVWNISSTDAPTISTNDVVCYKGSWYKYVGNESAKLNVLPEPGLTSSTCWKLL